MASSNTVIGKKIEETSQSNDDESIGQPCLGCRNRNEMEVNAIDKMSQIFFPVTFFVFNLYYWIYYIYF